MFESEFVEFGEYLLVSGFVRMIGFEFEWGVYHLANSVIGQRYILW